MPIPLTLRDVCELCEFNEPITFICFALSSGVPPQVVMKWTGHSDYKAMKPYIDIAEKTKTDAMKSKGQRSIQKSRK
jgi:hypothetical protein